MSLNINARQDCSFLFSGMTTRSGSSLGNLNFLSDYASIKNGSYGKLMKAYFKKVGNEEDSKSSENDKSSKVSTSLASDSAKTLASIDSSADKLKDSADALLKRGSDSLFKTKDVTVTDENGAVTTASEYDMDAIYKGVSSFVDSYNKLLDDTAKSDSASVEKAVGNMTNLTKVYSGSLEKVGITIGKDNKLSIDEEMFKASDGNTLKSMFNGSTSFAYSVSSQASFIDYAASREASKANTYSFNGKYNNNYSIGNLFNSMF